MRKLVLSLISSALVASCASAPENPWAGLEFDVTPAVKPLDCGAFPLPTNLTEDSMVYDKAGANALNAYRVCSEANEALGFESAATVDQLKIARKALVEAGQAQRNIADMKQEMLDDERRHNFFTKIGLYLVIIGMGTAL